MDTSKRPSDEGSELAAWVEELIENEEWEELSSIMEQLAYDEKYYKLNKLKPYEYQLKMFNAGKDHIARFACLANRIGLV